jgi:hypothetical protein
MRSPPFWRPRAAASIRRRSSPNSALNSPRASLAPTPSESLLGAKAALEAQAADEGLTSRNPWRIDWSTLLRRTYDLDVLRCECGGSLKVVALVTDRETALEILERLGVPTEPLARARSPDRLLAG